MSQYAGSRFGQDSPSRIASTTELLLEAGEMPPGEPRYQPLVPFYPPNVVSGAAVAAGALTTSDDDEDWKAYPDRLDLHVYQGDDVQIPLFFQDPANPTKNMDTGYEWKAQVRTHHAYNARLVNQFATEATYTAPAGEITVGVTTVTLFLPRLRNKYRGIFRWDLQSTSLYEGPTFAMPPGVDPEDWPPTTQVKTWVFGLIYVVPRVTATDVLPVPPNAIDPLARPVTITPTGIAVGPNGRVP